MFQEKKASKPGSSPKISMSEEVDAGDFPQVAARRRREKKTISQMVALYCAGNHSTLGRTEKAYCGEAVCLECLDLDDYAVKRTERCRRMDVKISCEACGNHCYQPEQREKIRQVMRWSGPRMLGKHPLAAIRHLMGK